MKFYGLVLSFFMGLFLTSAASANTATVDLTFFLQQITVSNSAASTSNITAVTYSLGTAGDGVATWDGFNGGTASDFLSDPNFFQTVDFSTNIAAGGSSFLGDGDIDLINTLVPLSVTGTTSDEQYTDPGISLLGAFVSVFWNDGSSGTTALENLIWDTNQSLTVSSSVSEVPVPAGLPLIVGALGVLGFLGRRGAARTA